MKWNGTFTPPTHTEMQIHGHPVDEKDDLHIFLPFEQKVWIINAKQHKKKLETRATQTQYLRCVNKATYQVNRNDTKRITTVKTCKFVLVLTKEPRDAI